jgi:hypothetical protein
MLQYRFLKKMHFALERKERSYLVEYVRRLGKKCDGFSRNERPSLQIKFLKSADVSHSYRLPHIHAHKERKEWQTSVPL